MDPEFAEASKTIFRALREAISVSADGTEPLEDIETRYLGELLRAEKGRPPLKLLVEASVSLERAEFASSLSQSLKQLVVDFGLEAFRMTDRFGRLGDAQTVLADRMLGAEGFVNSTNLQFEEIKINLYHIDEGSSDEPAKYARRSMKHLKYSMIAELKAYVRATRSVIDASAHLFSSLTSLAMNKAIGLKQAAERQQMVLIKVRRRDTDHLNSHELNVINFRLLLEFLNEGMFGASVETFSQRLHALVDRTLPLSVFEDAYTLLGMSSSREWSQAQQVTTSLGHRIEAVLDDARAKVETMIDVTNENHLPEEINTKPLVEPFVDTIQETLEQFRAISSNWLGVVRDVQTQLQIEQHGDS